MTDTRDHQAELLGQLLRSIEFDPSEGHPHEEALAQFVDGSLTPNERSSVVEHLSVCTHCRLVASELLKMIETEVAMEPAEPATARLAKPVSQRRRLRYGLMALAAALLIAVTLALDPGGWQHQLAESRTYRQAERLLASNQFSAARAAIATAREQGTDSDRLHSLDAQAIREMPDPVALRVAGRLTDFGVDVSGAIARDTVALPVSKGLVAAQQSLAGTGDSDLETLLNRGHVALAANRLPEALSEFDRAVQLAPQNSLGWLGRGMAEYLNDQLAPAERDFRKAAELDPQRVEPLFNLALTLQELGQTQQALETWKALRQRSLSEEERRLVKLAISHLEQP